MRITNDEHDSPTQEMARIDATRDAESSPNAVVAQNLVVVIVIVVVNGVDGVVDGDGAADIDVVDVGGESSIVRT